MINQDNKNYLKDLETALGFLMKDEIVLRTELDILHDKKVLLEVELDEINNEYFLLMDKGKKDELFSPSIMKEYTKHKREIDKKKSILLDKLRVLNENIEEYNIKNNNIVNLLNCIDSINKEYIKLNVNNSNLNNEYGIKILETQESERKRIARELHDSTVQNLTNMMHKTELCTKLIDIDPLRAKLELHGMNNTIRSTIKDMRGIIYNLRPMSLDDLGLVATIEKYIREIGRSYEIDISLDLVNEEIKNISVINLTLYRIVQEATNNSLKHGKSTKIVIRLEYTDKDIILSIKDNGIGFNYDESMSFKVDELSGYGLSMMKERVVLLSGNISITSIKNKGTEILVRAPQRTYKEDI